MYYKGRQTGTGFEFLNGIFRRELDVIHLKNGDTITGEIKRLDRGETQASGELSDTQARYVGQIVTGSSHLLELINDILDLSRIEAGRLDLALEEFDVVSNLQEIVELVTPVAAKKRLSLLLEVNGDGESSLPPIKTDPAKFKQIFYNLLSSSVKFTPEGGRVTMKGSVGQELEEARENSGAETSRFFLIAVADTGIGIRVEDQESIFEPL